MLNVPQRKCADGSSHVVVLLLDAISRPLFEDKYGELIKYMKSANTHHYIQFDNHHTFGPNSPPNKWPLFGGMLRPGPGFLQTWRMDWPLSVIQSWLTAHTGSRAEWLHTKFKDAGYVTIHGDDICDPEKKSGTLTSIMGSQGVTPAADVMPHPKALCEVKCVEQSCCSQSTYEFVAQAFDNHRHCNVFATLNPNVEHSVHWWYSKSPLWAERFLRRVLQPNTILVAISDHGLHYGEHNVDPVGDAYRTNPFLIVLWPKSLEQRGELKALQRSSTANVTTHLNVYGFLSGIAGGTDHGVDSIGAPNFPLNQSCDDAHIPPDECRCARTGTCSAQTIERARRELAKALGPVSEDPLCSPLNASDFSVVWCRGDGSSHNVAFKSGHRSYRLTWDDRNTNLFWLFDQRTLTQQSVYKADIDPCRDAVPDSLWHLCICRTMPSTFAKPSKRSTHSTNAMELFNTFNSAFSYELAVRTHGSIQSGFWLIVLLLFGALACAGCAVARLLLRAHAHHGSHGSSFTPTWLPSFTCSMSSPRCPWLQAVSPLTAGVSVLLTMMSTLQSIVVQFSKVGGRVHFHIPTAVFLTESVKLVVSGSLYLWRHRQPAASRTREPADATSTPLARLMGVVAYAFPALLYLIQNNLTLRAMELLDPPTFQLWVCFRLLPAAVFTRVLLKRSLTLHQWLALLLLMVGMGITTLPSPAVRGRLLAIAHAVQHSHLQHSHQHANVSSSKSIEPTEQSEGLMDNTTRGALILIVNGFISGASGVINEWLLKHQDPSLDFNMKNMRIYAWGMLFGLPMIRPPWDGGLRGFGVMGWVVVCTNAALGLTVALVLKFADNLIKNFASSAAVILSALISTVLFGYVIKNSFMMGAIVVCCSFILYFHDVGKGKPAVSAANREEGEGLLAAKLDGAPNDNAPPYNTVITFGTFDVLHYGHIRILQRARALGRRLVVGVSSDGLNMSKKSRAPIYPFDQRKLIIESLECVDEVFAEESLEKKGDYCLQFGADVLVMGDDWEGRFDELCNGIGIKAHYLKRTPAISTTETIEVIKSIGTN